jgi:hypothetical protein
MSGWQDQRRDPRQRPATPPQWQQQDGRPPADPWAGSAPGGSYGQPQYPRQQQLAPVFPAGYQGQPNAQGYYPPPQYGQPAQAPRKRRRVFLWVFLAIQVLFIIWIITGAASNPAGQTAAQQAAQQCANGGWQGLFKSQADCQVHYAHALNEAATAGKGIGVALIVVFWVVVDFFLGLGYGIYRLASRR